MMTYAKRILGMKMLICFVRVLFLNVATKEVFHLAVFDIFALFAFSPYTQRMLPVSCKGPEQ